MRTRKEVRTFILKPEHLLLLKRMFTSWFDCEFGAPSIDPKRPYGNSDVLKDMKEILGKSFTKKELNELHKEMQTVLQIVVRNCNLEPGTYQTDKYDYCGEYFVLVKDESK